MRDKHKQLRERCGVFGMYNQSGAQTDVGDIAFLALHAMQHRGQDGAGIATSDGRDVYWHKDIGLVSEVFGARTLSRLKGSRMVMGHVHNATADSPSTMLSTQPLVMHGRDGFLAIAHNGHIVNGKYLFDYFARHHPRIAAQGAYFHPAFPSGALYPKSFAPKEKWSFLLNNRPDHPGNLSSYGKEIIGYCIAHGVIDTQKWNVLFADAIASRRKYADCLRKADLALSLMYAPHPGYPLYEVACSGGVVVSNACYAKTHFERCENVILADLDFDRMVQAVEKGVALAQNLPARKQNYENSAIPRSWHGELAHVIAFMRERMASCGI